MINENEIRVGNMFEYSDKHPEANCMLGIPMVWTDVEWYRLGDCIEDLEYYNPIKLTEDWLLKFGFECYEFDNGEPNQYRLKNRLIVIRNNVFYDYGADVKIEFVHKLQNLYNALTNDELAISR